MKRWLEDRRFGVVSFCYFLVTEALDLVSSVLPMPPDAQEMNPFTRDAQHHFMLGRGIAVKLLIAVALMTFAGSLYYGLKSWSRQLALFAFSVPFIYYGTDVLLNAVLPNLLMSFGWHQP